MLKAFLFILSLFLPLIKSGYGESYLEIGFWKKKTREYYGYNSPYDKYGYPRYGYGYGYGYGGYPYAPNYGYGAFSCSYCIPQYAMNTNIVTQCYYQCGIDIRQFNSMIPYGYY